MTITNISYPPRAAGERVINNSLGKSTAVVVGTTMSHYQLLRFDAHVVTCAARLTQHLTRYPHSFSRIQLSSERLASSTLVLCRGTLFADEHMREKPQGYVMLYEMLLGKGSIQGGGKLKVQVFLWKNKCTSQNLFRSRWGCAALNSVVRIPCA